MEIAANQSGQPFASLPVATDAPAKVTNQAVNSEEVNKESDTSSSINTEARNENDVNTVQDLSLRADTVKREDQSEALSNAVREVESFIQVQNRNLTFSVDEDTAKAVVTVKDSESGDVIRQIPSEEVLKLAERIQELQQDIDSSVGVFINNEV